jgi:aerobic-type carbon monoxide dehydrogenase small subunit (CoxS/CutS family)
VLPEGLLKFKLNGNVVERSCSLTRPLAWTLRETFDLHGTKVACGQGNCGACTVLVKSPDEDEAKPVNACLFATGSLLMSKDSSHAAEQMFEFTTIEGVDNDKTDSDHECFSKAIVEWYSVRFLYRWYDYESRGLH